jgi:site-specific recombinase XerD
MKDPSQVQVSGPLEPFAVGFGHSLMRQGYTPNSAIVQVRLMAHLSRWLASRGLDARELRTTDVERFLRARRGAGYTHYLSAKAMRPMLTYLRDEGVSLTPAPTVADTPVDGAVERYRQYLIQERGLGSASARVYVDAVRPFMRGRISRDGLALDWHSLDAADVTAFVVARTPNQSPSSAKLTVSALRSLLGFLHVEGSIARPLTSAVPSVAGWRLAGLPKALEPGEIQVLFASCDRRTRTGRRDFAVLTTLVRLGLRAGELAALRFDDIDWRAGTIVIRGKGHQIEQLPWPVDVAEAVVAYLRRGRATTAEGRTLFVRVKAPNRALSTGGVSQIVVAAARRAGLKRVHAHRLRHTAATQLLRAGAGLPEIGQLLRHRRLETTAIYAKVDRDALRAIARPWLGGVA